jgi:hypothetical protein
MQTNLYIKLNIALLGYSTGRQEIENSNSKLIFSRVTEELELVSKTGPHIYHDLCCGALQGMLKFPYSSFLIQRPNSWT